MALPFVKELSYPFPTSLKDWISSIHQWWKNQMIFTRTSKRLRAHFTIRPLMPNCRENKHKARVSKATPGQWPLFSYYVSATYCLRKVCQYSQALSFYRSQNVLSCSKFFVPHLKSIDILWQSQIFCDRQKNNLHSVKLVFVLPQKFLKRH